jgi:hypothetical protein
MSGDRTMLSAHRFPPFCSPNADKLAPSCSATSTGPVSPGGARDARRTLKDKKNAPMQKKKHTRSKTHVTINDSSITIACTLDSLDTGKSRDH